MPVVRSGTRIQELVSPPSILHKLPMGISTGRRLFSRFHLCELLVCYGSNSLVMVPSDFRFRLDRLARTLELCRICVRFSALVSALRTFHLDVYRLDARQAGCLNPECRRSCFFRNSARRIELKKTEPEFELTFFVWNPAGRFEENIYPRLKSVF